MIKYKYKKYFMTKKQKKKYSEKRTKKLIDAMISIVIGMNNLNLIMEGMVNND